MFLEGHFELRKKVKFPPMKATDEEKALFKSEWGDTRDKFLLQPDQELFVGVKKPASAPKEPGFETVFTIAGILAVACMVLRRNR